MSTEYYLGSIPENSLQSEQAKTARRSLINDHSLDKLLEMLVAHNRLETETVRVLNRGIRGPYGDGHYCGFVFDKELNFWTKLIQKYPDNGMLNLIYAEYLVQKEKGYFNAHTYYHKAFEADYRLIFMIEPSWRDELLEQGFDYKMYYLRTQKDDYGPEDFDEVVNELLEQYKDEPEKLSRIRK